MKESLYRTTKIVIDTRSIVCVCVCARARVFCDLIQEYYREVPIGIKISTILFGDDENSIHSLL